MADEETCSHNTSVDNEFLKCPRCESTELYRDGIRYLADYKPVQRWLCRNCGYRFSEKRPLQEKRNWQINSADAIVSRSQVCELLQESKNLTEIARQETASREGTKTNSAKAEVKGKILEFEWWLKKGGYRESTILGYASVLKSLMNKGSNLLDANSVKETIAMQDQWSIGRKAVAAKAYTKFLEKLGLKWQKPIYEAPRKLPFIPAEKELDDLIAGTTAKTSTFLQLLKETGMRAGEAYQLKWTDLDFATNTVRITPEKHSNPRMFKLSNRLIAMLNRLPHTKETIFTFKRLNHLRRTYQRQRRRIAHKFGNPRLTQITFHTFRHWKATNEYHKTKDILYVMQLLGHKNIKNTLIYTQLISTKDDDFVCKAAKTVDEASKLVEAGFEFVCEIQDCRLFRKRK